MFTEVEKKYPVIEEACKDGLLSEAEFVSESEHADTYYDTDGAGLLRKDMFLRRRDGIWELKVGQPGSGDHGVRQYEEVTDEDEIRRRLFLAAEGTLEEALRAEGYSGFVTLQTVRRKYKLGTLTIDFDQTTFPQGDTFDMMELELLVEDREAGKAQLLELEDRFWLPAGQEMRGKVQEYCYRHDPDRWRIFQETGLAVE